MKTRKEILSTVYGTESMNEIQEQFKNSLLSMATEKDIEKRNAHLLEQIIFFNYALTYQLKAITMTNYRTKFMTIAKASKGIKLSSKRVERAFSFLTIITEKKVLDANPKPTDDDKAQKPTKEDFEVVKFEKNLAQKELGRLVDMLHTKDLTLPRRQKREDYDHYIRVAIVALATGSKFSEIENPNFSIDNSFPIIEVDGKVSHAKLRAWVTLIQKHEGVKTLRGIIKGVAKLGIKGTATEGDNEPNEVVFNDIRSLEVVFNDIRSLIGLYTYTKKHEKKD